MNDINKRQEFVELRAKGNTYKKISERLKVPIRTLFYWAKEYQKEIRFMKSAEREHYLASLKLDDFCQYKIISEELKKIDSALKRKEYEMYPLKDLLRWKYRLLDKISKIPALDEQTIELYSHTNFYFDARREEADQSFKKEIESSEHTEQNKNAVQTEENEYAENMQN